MCYIGSLRQQGSFKLVSRGGLAWLECHRLARLPQVVHAFSTRRGGTSKRPLPGLNLGFVEADRPSRVRRNRRLFLQHLDARHFSLASLRQIHSVNIYQVVEGAAGELEYRLSGHPALRRSTHRLPAGDALITDRPGILLSVRSADCLSVLLADPRRPAVAVIHAGWRGTLQRVVEKTVGVMRAVFGSDPPRLLAVLGPSIRVCCYAVGEQVVDAFHGAFLNSDSFFRRVPPENLAATLATEYPPLFLATQSPAHSPLAPSAAHLNLVAVAKHQLCTAGVRPSNIEVADFCTACRTDLFFSHRKEGRGTGRVMAVIGLKDDPKR